MIYLLLLCGTWRYLLKQSCLSRSRVSCFAHTQMHFSSKKSRIFSPVSFSTNAKGHFFLVFIFSWKLKLLQRIEKGNWQEHKTYKSLTWSKLHFRGCSAPFKARGMKSFLASAVFQSAGKAELNGRGTKWLRTTVVEMRKTLTITISYFLVRMIKPGL